MNRHPSLTRRELVFATGLAALGSPFAARAQAFPSKSLRIIVPYAPGGATDTLARQLGGAMSEKIGQQVVVENRTGGATVIAAQALISSPADGYTMAFFDPSTVAMNQYLFKKPPYDPAKSIAPVSMLTRIPFGIMVQQDHPMKNLADFVANVKSKPGQPYGHSGAGNPVHLAMERFIAQAGLQMTHVPYKGGAPAVQELIGGQVPYLMMDIPSAMPFIKAGRVRVLALTSSRRSELLPDTPTIAESGYPGFEASSWFGAFVPAGTPPAAIARLNQVLREAIVRPDVTAWIKDRTLEPAPSSPEELAAAIKSDEAKYSAIIKQLNFSLD